jgi:hypothetical protein
MLFGHHDTGLGGVDGRVGSLLTDLQPHLIKRLMARASYATVQEQEAEMFASVVHSSGRCLAPVGPSADWARCSGCGPMTVAELADAIGRFSIVLMWAALLIRARPSAGEGPDHHGPGLLS